MLMLDRPIQDFQLSRGQNRITNSSNAKFNSLRNK